MRIHKLTTYLVIIALFFAMLPVTAYSASDNRISRVVTVGKNEILQGQNAPQLIISMKDELEREDTFYLLLEGAEWAVGSGINEILGEISGVPANVPMPALEIRKLSTRELQIRVKDEAVPAGASLRIPMTAKITGETATVKIDNNNTTVSANTYTFAHTMDYRGKVTSRDVKTATGSSVMAELVIEEPYAQAFHKEILKGRRNKLQIILNTNDYEFAPDLTSLGVPHLKGIKGFDTLSGGVQNLRKIDAQTLELTLPDLSTQQHTGGFVLSGVGLKTTHNSPAQGKITASIEGDLIFNTTVNVLEVTDYGISLSADSKEQLIAGKSKTVTFTLEEKVTQSLIRERKTDFTFTNGARVRLNQQNRVDVTLNGTQMALYPIFHNNKPVGFEVPTLPGTAMKYNFNVMLDVPVHVEGTIEVIAEGRSLIHTLSEPILDVKAPVKVSITPMHLRLGLKDQVGGKITITELAKGEIRQDALLFVEVEPNQVLFTKPPVVQVTAGDIRLGTPKVVAGGFEIPVTRRSNTASTIEIKDFTVTVNQIAAEGSYWAAVGGSALSDFAISGDIDPVLKSNFMTISKEGAPGAKEQVTFRIDQLTYSVGGQPRIMDAAPYIRNGRTMLPIKYVALALGISENNVMWNPTTRTVTVIGKERIELQIGSTIMRIDGVPRQMSAPPEITNSRTFVPVAEITRALGVETKWDSDLRMVIFN